MSNGLRFIARCAACCTALLWLVACGGGDDNALAGYSEECVEDEDCEVGLLCIGVPGLCTVECINDGPCKVESETGICTDGHCYDKCTAETQSCPNPNLTCTMAGTTLGTCRP